MNIAFFLSNSVNSENNIQSSKLARVESGVEKQKVGGREDWNLLGLPHTRN